MLPRSYKWRCQLSRDMRDEAQKACRRLLRADRQKHRQRQHRADQVLALAAVEDPGGEQQERVGEDVEQIDDAEHRGGKVQAARRLADVLLAGLHMELADLPGRRAQGQVEVDRLTALHDRREQGVIGVGRVPWPDRLCRDRAAPSRETGKPSIATILSPDWTPAALAAEPTGKRTASSHRPTARARRGCRASARYFRPEW